MAKYIGKHRRQRIGRADHAAPVTNATPVRENTEERELVLAGR